MGSIRGRGLILLTIGLFFGIPLLIFSLAMDHALVRTVFILITVCPLVLALRGLLEAASGRSLRDPSLSWSRTRAIVRFLLPASFLVMLLALSVMILFGGMGRAGFLR